MERGSDKHSPRLDEQLEKETRSFEQGSPAGSRVEEFRDPEGPDDDEELAERMKVNGRSNGDMGREEIERRSAIAKYLDRSIFPADRAAVIRAARSRFAPERLLERLEGLPVKRFENVEAVWEALGGAHEHRF